MKGIVFTEFLEMQFGDTFVTQIKKNPTIQIKNLIPR